MTGPARALLVEGISVRYGAVEAVREVSFSVAAGEVFGLLGPNGAGKSSVMRVLTTLARPSAGRAWVLGHEVGAEPANVRRLIGYVPQALSADGSLTGRENAMLFARLYFLPRASRRGRVNDVLGLMGLGAVAERLVRTYSGGMIRRLEIACGLLGRPKLLLLDEPTIGLDPVARRGVWEHLHEVRSATGMTLLVTTHAMDEAQENCGRVAVMASGRILAEGSLEQLQVSSGQVDGSLEAVFIALTRGDTDDREGGLHAVNTQRRTARRLG